jgi:hypothetical protein
MGGLRQKIRRYRGEHSQDACWPHRLGERMVDRVSVFVSLSVIFGLEAKHQSRP